jgi:hypothetical protein
MQKTEIFPQSDEVSPFAPIKFHQRGGRKIIIQSDDSIIQKTITKTTINTPLINTIARAFYWSKLIDSGVVCSGSEIALREGLEPSTVNERLRLSLLSPAIIKCILLGKHSEGLTTQSLTRNSLPADWNKQEEYFNAFMPPLTPSKSAR